MAMATAKEKGDKGLSGGFGSRMGLEQKSLACHAGHQGHQKHQTPTLNLLRSYSPLHLQDSRLRVYMFSKCIRTHEDPVPSVRTRQDDHCFLEISDL